jgi:hypothetical protein
MMVGVARGIHLDAVVDEHMERHRLVFQAKAKHEMQIAPPEAEADAAAASLQLVFVFFHHPSTVEMEDPSPPYCSGCAYAGRRMATATATSRATLASVLVLEVAKVPDTRVTLAS